MSYKPTSEQIWKASEDVKYEWQQLWECKRLENSFRDPTHPNVVVLDTPEKKRLYSLAIESFAIHARNLLLFFFEPRKGEFDDIIASDYFDIPTMWTPPQISGKDDEWRKSIQNRANKRAAHLTYTRVDKSLPEIQWQVEEIYNYLAVIWQYFVSTASSQRFDRS